MKGVVDEQMRALISVPVAAARDENKTELNVWVDTAFIGGLAIPYRQIVALGLTKKSSVEAILADGNKVILDTYNCFLEWFGALYETQIVANDAEHSLLGTVLLADHKLEIDYTAKTVTVS